MGPNINFKGVDRVLKTRNRKKSYIIVQETKVASFMAAQDYYMNLALDCDRLEEPLGN